MVDETLKLRPAVQGEPLRVGIWLDSATGPAWIGEVIRQIRATSGLTLAAVFAGTAARSTARESLAYRWYRNWCSRRAKADPLASVDLSREFAGISLEQPAKIREHTLDVLIWLGDAPPSEDCFGLARCGVWSFGQGDSNLPIYFGEMYHRNPVSTLRLYSHAERFDQARVLYCYDAATRETFYAPVNSIEPYSMAPVILIRRLLDLREHGAEWMERVFTEKVQLGQRREDPGAWILGSFLVAAFVRRVRAKLRRRRGELEWFIAFRRDAARVTSRNESFRPEGFTPIANPPGYHAADPFLIRRDGRVFLFLELFTRETGFGHLAVMEMLSEGLSAPVAVLEAPYHLSYPCLIERDGEVFMLPETSEHRTVELYRASDFPRGWKLAKTLLNDVTFVDTTPFHQDGWWYFFASTVDPPSGYWIETFLFYADALDGEWRYHPENPICSDIRRARGAGNLFYRNGKLIRPAQDCSIRYGYAIVFNEVLELSPEHYREQPVEVILPTWQPGLECTHTLNALDDIEVIDGARTPA